MHTSPYLWVLAGLTSPLLAIPVQKKNVSSTNSLSNLDYGPVPGQSSLYNDYHGKSPPFPLNTTSPILPTTTGPPGVDDELFQNLLAAEGIIFNFYQQAVEMFNESSFTSLGYPNTTYDSIAEIRDNEAGHFRIFQNSISSASVKPGTCKYDFGFTDALSFLALQTLIEPSSTTFLTGLAQQAQARASRGNLVGIAAVETRHATWALTDVWNTSPFAGPSDTVYPYPNQILEETAAFIIPGSCPSQNPPFPNPSQHLPQLRFNANTSDGHPGSPITFTYKTNVPNYQSDRDYYAVFFHGLNNITVPFDTIANSTTIPAEFDKAKGIILAVIADKAGAPTQDNVIAGPLFLLQQPESLTSVTA